MVNLSLALFFLAFLVPVAAHFGSRTTTVQVLLVIVCTPFVLLTVLCLVSAARPGCLGRTARRLRR